MPAKLNFSADLSCLDGKDHLIVVGKTARLREDDVRALLPAEVTPRVWDRMTNWDAGDDGRVSTQWLDGAPERLSAGVIPNAISRHNAPSQPFAVHRCLNLAGRRGSSGVVVAVEDEADAYGAALAVARAHPTYSAASKSRERSVEVLFLGPNGPVSDLERAQEGAAALRAAAYLVDGPPDMVNTRFVLERAQQLSKLPHVSITVIQGEALQQAGLGGLWAVGRAATEPPALVVLDYAPPSPKSHLAWVGKGVVYDTGGLSLKPKLGMVGMKTDMAGAAAVLCAFGAAVRLACAHRLTAVLCLAENAIGPTAIRPDDIIKLYSGRTVEINNTDAEGRLVLSDGLAWVTKHREPDELLDMATLTGAQAMATGKRHGALYCSDGGLEDRVVAAGRCSGDLVHPLPYVPEFFRKEFSSTVADMRNSVKDRSNAQASCAGQFLRNHIRGWDRPWVHVDMAAPSKSASRATGWGVGLLLTLAGVGATIEE